MSANKSSQPTIALVLGILGILCCPVLGPIAWYLGGQELKKIAAGNSDASGEGLARAGKILGIVGTVFILFWFLWIALWGGMAVIQGITGNL